MSHVELAQFGITMAYSFLTVIGLTMVAVAISFYRSK